MFEPPGPDRLARSRELEALIREEMEREGGWIDFERYMTLAMSAPGLGYYTANADVFGAAGDYVTAPGLGGLFAACLATQVADVLSDPGLAGGAGGSGEAPGILEFGAGIGDLAADLLLELERLGAPPVNYHIVETSPALRFRQQQRIRDLPESLSDRVTWLDRLPTRFDGVVLANEVLDAMPFHRFRILEDGSAAALGVRDTSAGMTWAVGPATAEMAGFAATLGLPAGYESEWSRQAPAWVRSVGERLGAGVMLLVDYGYDRATYYHPDRRTGTMHCHYRHQTHDDPFLWPGLQDITAHVDFTAIAAAGAGSGLALQGYLDQAGFLIGAGFAEIYAERHAGAGVGSPRAISLANEARRLTMPHEMGEQFKVVALGRGCRPPAAFAGRDQSHRLAA